MEQLPDRTFRFRTVVVLVARQNGKSTLAQVLALYFMYVRCVKLVIGTAQNLDIAEEVWQGAIDIAEDVPDLAAEIKHVVKTNGKKSLELVDLEVVDGERSKGRRYKVQAANRRGGRGLSGDLVIMDELREHQSWDSWSAVTKTTLARILAQIWALSNAGDALSIVLGHLRAVAHRVLGDPDGICAAGTVDQLVVTDVEDVEEDSLGLFEWSAPPDCDVADRAGWAMANPSLGYTITERAIASALRTDPEWVFRTEVLCQWASGMVEGPFPPGAWAMLADPDSVAVGPVVYAVDVDPDRAWGAIAVAGARADGRTHTDVGIVERGTDWIVPRCAQIDADHGPTVFIIDGHSPAASLKTEMEDAGLDVIIAGLQDVAQASQQATDAVINRTMAHRGQLELTTAVAAAQKRVVGDGQFVFSRRGSIGITPWMACVLAMWGHNEGKGGGPNLW